MPEPGAVVFYVNDLPASTAFYQDLLEIKPEKASPTFHSFKLSNGMVLGLKAKQTFELPVKENGQSELAFTMDNQKEIDALFVAWQQKEISISQAPSVVPYGYAFVALDPDGNRLHVVSLK